MNLAIACLRKSNELSYHEDPPLLMESDYLRLVKYLRFVEVDEGAMRAEKAKYARYPEFADRRLSNLPKIRESSTSRSTVGRIS